MTGDSRSLVYVTAHGLKRLDLESGGVEDIPHQLEWRRELPEGSFVVHAGQLFDGRTEALQRDVDIMIEGHRIREIVPHAESQHRGRVIDASEGTVMPGLFEMHTHQGAAYGESLGRLWLAYGITSVREPASNPFESRERLESIESDAALGRASFSPGRPSTLAYLLRRCLSSRWRGTSRSGARARADHAEALGVADDLGSIEAGKLADLVVVEGNPLQNIHDARVVRVVIANGKVYELEDLLKRP